MKPETQLKRLEAWYEALISGEYTQAYDTYKIKEDFCCLAVANQIRGNHSEKEYGAIDWLCGDILPYDFMEFDQVIQEFIKLNDEYKMSFHEIADIVLEQGINPLRAALGMDSYEDEV